VLVRLPLVLARAFMDVLPVAAFAAAGYGVATLLGLAGNVRVAAVTVITAYAGVRLIVILARMLAAPRTPTLRLLAVDDETAEYLVIWVRRLAGIGLFGYFIADAARLLGLPRSGFNAVLKGLGLAIAAMLVVFILQNRAQVAAAIRRAAQRWDWGRRLGAVTGRLADIWHVLAIAYVGAVYVVWAIPVRGGFEYILRATLLTAVILAAAALASTLIKHLIDRGFAVSQEARERFPELEARANRYLPVLHMAFRSVVVAVTVLAILQAWGLETFSWVASELGRRVLASGISIVAVLAGALVLWELASGAIERYLAATAPDGSAIERSARARTLLPLARNALMVVLVVMVALIVLSELGVNIAPLLAGAGVIGIAVGFGSQKLVQDVITGAFILFEDTISVGDVVRLDAHAGVVEAMSIRAIRLRDLNGNVHTIPFSAVGTIVNMTKEFSYAVIDVGVAYREDTDAVTEVLKGLDEELRADAEFGPLIVEPMEVLGVDRFDASAVVIRVRFKTQPIKQWSVMREFNRRMKKRFDELGIEIPFPQTTVWFGEDRKGAAPPMRLRIEGRKDEARTPVEEGTS
ncbi:MAG: mechanosensitive ion channel domain-containing protein, partial [Pseudomonadota bacterium]